MTGRAAILPGHVRSALAALDELLDGATDAGDLPTLHGIPLLAARSDDLAQHLYAAWYVAWAPRPEPTVPTAVVADPPRALRAAHSAARHLEPGWTVERSSSAGRAVVARGGARRLVTRGDVLVPARPGRRAAPGDEVAVTRLVDEVDEDGGFWITYHPDWREQDAMLRCYWRIAPRAAPRLVALLGTALRDVPHALKLAASWEGYARADAAVLYLPRHTWPTAAPAVAATAAALGEDLTGAPPRCTRPLAPGLGIADGAGDGTSFGQHRCRLVADALVAWAAARDGRPLVHHLAAAFADAGLDLARPHLDAGSSDVAWPPPAEAGGSLPARASAGAGVPTVPRPAGEPVAVEVGAADTTAPGDRELVAAAVRLADRICDDAVWHEDRCTWLGAASRQVGGTWRPVVTSAGGDLYEGTAGVGWLLAQVGARTGERRHRATALGALRHAALRHAAAPGLWTGVDGVAVAAAGIARATGADEAAGIADRLRQQVATRLATATPRDVAAGPHDLLAGTAGTLLAARALDLASPAVVGALVQGLRAAAVDQPVGRAWPDPHAAGSPPLCGLAHGAAGIALALLEVDPAVAPDAAPLAHAAMAYEQSWFDRAQGDWPDLREYDRAARRTGQLPTTVTYWCHGALGVGLQRLRAWQRTGDAALLLDVAVALQAAGVLAGRLLDATPDADPFRSNVSACHGASAAAGLFTTAGSVLGDPELVEAGRRIARWMVETFGDGARPWPCGVAGGGETHGLALGLAGVAWTLLHAADPTAVAPLGLLPLGSLPSSALPSSALLPGAGRAGT